MIGTPGPRPVPSGLGARIIGFLSIALVPLGVVSYLQTSELHDVTRERAALNVIGLTETAISAERRNIQNTLAAAQTLSAISDVVAGDPLTCYRHLAEVQRSDGLHNFLGVIDTDANLMCLSAQREADLTVFPLLVEAAKSREPSVLRIDNPPLSDEPVVVVSSPFFDGDVLKGQVLISFSVAELRSSDGAVEEPGFVDVITFNKQGQILSTTVSPKRAKEILPKQTNFSELAGGNQRSFQAVSGDGQERIFSVSTSIPGLVTAVSVWPLDSVAAQAVDQQRFARALPLLMWAASVIVAYLAVNRLVIRHIRTLRRQMRGFARNRRVPSQKTSPDMALELQDMENDFLNMVESIMRDEAQLEDALHEKTILLKEVHHRVKNNLQLISSIMNMQIRQAQHDETRMVLQRLQDRILGLATVHRSLYQSEDLGKVQTHDLVNNLIDQICGVKTQCGSRVDVIRDIDEVELYPDQAVPLSLLIAEALTNAGKYGGPDDQGVCELRISVKSLDDRKVSVVISNTSDPHAERSSTGETGLGSRLIRAFVTQLGGDLEQGLEDQCYAVKVLFTISDFKPEVVDY